MSDQPVILPSAGAAAQPSIVRNTYLLLSIVMAVAAIAVVVAVIVLAVAFAVVVAVVMLAVLSQKGQHGSDPGSTCAIASSGVKVPLDGYCTLSFLGVYGFLTTFAFEYA